MNLAFQATGSLGASEPVSCPRISKRDGFAPGTLTIVSALAVLCIAVLSPLYVQLFIATAAGLLGIWVVRKRYSPPVAVGEPAGAQRKAFRSDTNRLSVVGDAMLHKTRKANQPLCIVVFDFSDLPELQTFFGGPFATSLGSEIAGKLQGIAPAKAAVVRTGPTRFAVLLPNFDGARARMAVREALGKACCLEFDLGNSEMLLVPEYTSQVVRREATSVEEVYQKLCRDLVKGQQHAERRQDYLTRERESHTRSLRLSSAEGDRTSQRRVTGHEPDSAEGRATWVAASFPADSATTATAGSD